MIGPGQRPSDLGLLQTSLAGAAGGVSYWLLMYPSDVIKSSIQSDHYDPAQRQYTGMAQAARTIYRRGGMAAFYRGYGVCLLRTIPASAATFVTYAYVMRHLTGASLDDEELTTRIVV